MSWLDRFFTSENYGTVQSDGTNMPPQSIINFAGAGVTVANDPTNTRTTITIPGGGGGSPGGSTGEIQTNDGAGGFAGATNVKAGANFLSIGTGTMPTDGLIRVSNATQTIIGSQSGVGNDAAILVKTGSFGFQIGSVTDWNVAIYSSYLDLWGDYGAIGGGGTGTALANWSSANGFDTLKLANNVSLSGKNNGGTTDLSIAKVTGAGDTLEVWGTSASYGHSYWNVGSGAAFRVRNASRTLVDIGGLAGDYVSFGTAAASAGTIRLPDGGSIKSVSGGLDRSVLDCTSGAITIGEWTNVSAIINRASSTIYNQIAATNYLTITSSEITAGAPLAIGTSPPATGTLRLGNAFDIKTLGGSTQSVMSHDGGYSLTLGSIDVSALNLHCYGVILLSQSGTILADMRVGAIKFSQPVLGYSSTNGAVNGRATQAMADANQTLSSTSYSRALIQTTGAITATRTLTFPHPASEDESYCRDIMQDCTGGGGFFITLRTGTGTTVNVASGGRGRYWFTPAGVSGPY